MSGGDTCTAFITKESQRAAAEFLCGLGRERPLKMEALAGGMVY